ncbi:hypothetical protein H312_02691 [Anncaliia algerae PRA339]|uniref:Uncharacterized protein n=1 Tax=Anncaliia algerae PRA339 TaxID=1288291 RepID=A0A059EXY5_9MICR|nr:hypothetical protein H312_02691 [Anncaliia algerae PRA339]
MEKYTIEIVLTLLKLFLCGKIKKTLLPQKDYHFAMGGKIKLTPNPECLSITDTSDIVIGSIFSMGVMNFDPNILTQRNEGVQLGKTYKPILREDYLKKLIDFLTNTYWIKAKTKPNVDNVKETLLEVYDNIPDTKELIVITWIIIFETEGFLKMHEEPVPEGDKWFTRGILQIYSEERYIQIANLTNNIEFIVNPDILCNLNLKATGASLMFWKDLIANAKKTTPRFRISWEKALILLKPKDLQPDQKDYEIKIRNALNLYVYIVNLLENRQNCGPINYEFVRSMIGAVESIPSHLRKKRKSPFLLHQKLFDYN